ncbi:MAG TPA: hypothetical protein VHZ03_03230, partial [Trebonia sp.]|nr:hypothetical protein [Trebonia sp.]
DGVIVTEFFDVDKSRSIPWQRRPEATRLLAELMRASGMTRPTLYRHLAGHADAGRAVQVSRGRWRAARAGDGSEP